MPDLRSSYGVPEGASALGHGGRIPATSELPVNRMHNSFTVEGSGTVRALASVPKGAPIFLHFTGAPTFVHSAKLLMPGGVNKRFAPGDIAALQSIGNGNWRCVSINAANPGPLFVFEGDSITDPASAGQWPGLLASQSSFFARGTSYNFALGGDTAALMVGEYPTQAGAITFGSGIEAFYFLFAGTNDIVSAASAATTYGYLTTLWALARASGYKVVAFTIMPRGDANSTQNDARIALNALIRSDTSLYDFLIEPDLILNNNADRTLFDSGAVHPTAVGSQAIASLVAAALQNVRSVTSIDAADVMNINPRLEVSQKNGTTAKTGLTGGVSYIVDGVTIQAIGPSVLTAQQVADAPPGFTNSLKVTVTTAESSIATSSLVVVRIPIEGFKTSKLAFGTVNAQPVTIGFWTKIHRTGSYSGALRNGAGGRTYPFSFTQNVADAWEFKTVVIPGDVTGTWAGNVSSVGLVAYFTVAAGTDFTSAANAWVALSTPGVTGTTNGVAATSDVFQLGPVAVLSGAYKLQAYHLQRILRPFDFDSELLRCKRYWQSTYDHGVAPGTATAVGARNLLVPATTNYADMGSWEFVPEMRAAPTVTLYSPATGATGKIRNGDTSADLNAGSASPSTKRVPNIYVNNVSASGTHGLSVHAVADAQL